jgi:hypothetical protein
MSLRTSARRRPTRLASSVAAGSGLGCVVGLGMASAADMNGTRTQDRGRVKEYFPQPRRGSVTGSPPDPQFRLNLQAGSILPLGIGKLAQAIRLPPEADRVWPSAG